MNKKWDYEKVKELFNQRGCEILDTEYKNNKSLINYVAICGHKHSISLDNFLKGKGNYCKECRYKNLSKQHQLGKEKIKDAFEKEGMKVLEIENGTNTGKVVYIARCGHKNIIDYMHFRTGGGRVCNVCSKSIKYQYSTVFEEFQKRGCRLISKEYVNSKEPLRYIAKCGHESFITFDEVMNAKNVTLKCPKCRKFKYYEIEDVEKIFDDNNCKLLSDVYKTLRDSLEYIPQCGHISYISFGKFLVGEGRVCSKCARPRGDRHHKYNPNLSDQDRQKREMQSGEWVKVRNQVYVRDNFMCQICGDSKGGNLVAHHIESWDKNKGKRFQLENIVTLCEKCHKKFHKQYGYGNNTKEQFDEYRNSFKVIDSNLWKLSSFFNKIELDAKTGESENLKNLIGQIIEIPEMIEESVKRKRYYRARLYLEPDAEERYINPPKGRYKGYDRKNSFVNLSGTGNRAGRFNKNGEHVLYISQTENTAIHEINPIKNDVINIAYLYAEEIIKSIDLSNAVVFLDYKDSLIPGVLNSTTITFLQKYLQYGNGENEKNYAVCQLIMKYVKEYGMDGIKYKSVKYSGQNSFNYAICNYEKYKVSSSKLVVFYE